MATISSPGIGSGLDINTLVSKLMQVEQLPLVQLQKKEASYQAQLSAFGTLSSAFSSLLSAAQALTGSTSAFTGMSASASDTTVLSASAGTTAAAGSYSIGVEQLAKYHAFASDPTLHPYAATTDTFHTGTLAIQIGGGTAVNVTIDGTNNTLAGIRDAINAAHAGVTAGIINDGTTNRLTLTSNTSGSAGAITVTATDSGSGGTHALTDMASANLVQTQAADDAKLSINNIAITRSSNTITDAITGVTLNLTKAGSIGAPVTTQLTVSRNTTASQSGITAFVNAYNTAVGQLHSLSAYNATTKTASTLTGDSTVRSLESQLPSLVETVVSGLSGGISRLSDVGIALQKDGTLAINSTKLQAALGDTTKDVAGLFSSTATGNNGVAVKFKDALTSMLSSSGVFSSRTDGINRSIKDLTKQQEAFQVRLTAIEARYRSQFNALDSLVASMNSTSTYLNQQLTALNNLAYGTSSKSG